MSGFLKKTFVILMLAALLTPAPCLAAITYTKVSDVDFGTSGVDPPVPTTGTNYLILGTNGTMTYDTQYASDSSDLPTIGVITISNTGTTVAVDIACESSASNFPSIANGTAGTGAATLPLSNIQIDVNATSGPGAATACNGLTNFVKSNISIPGGGSVTVRIGARVDATNAKVAGTYSTAGYDIAVRNHTTLAAYTGSPTLTFTATFVTAPVLAATTSMDWGSVSVTSTPVTSACHADLGTNGSVAYAGCFAAGPSGTPHAGAMTITGVPNGTTLTGYCDSTATLTNGAGASIQVTGIEINVPPLSAYFTPANCHGVSGAAAGSAPFSSTGTFAVSFGGKLDGATAVGTIAGAFSCTNSGGTCPNVVVTMP
jgi:hypothetical protein